MENGSSRKDLIRSRAQYDDRCNVCGETVSYEDNAIVFCDRCNVPVHQFCYGVRHLPPPNQPWYCKVCELGAFNAAKEQCIICHQKGGAFKQAKGNAGWCHVSCALWVPEVIIEDDFLLERIDVSRLNPQRRKLRCIVCKTRGGGACIQCATRACAVAFHPPCMLHKSQAIFHHVRALGPPGASGGGEVEVLYEAHCPGKHANCARRPGANPGMPPCVQYRPSDSLGPGGDPGAASRAPRSRFQVWEEKLKAAGLVPACLEPTAANRKLSAFEAIARQLQLMAKFRSEAMEAHFSVWAQGAEDLGKLRKLLGSHREWSRRHVTLTNLLRQMAPLALNQCPDLFAQVHEIATGKLTGPEYLDLLSRPKRGLGCRAVLGALCRRLGLPCIFIPEDILKMEMFQVGQRSAAEVLGGGGRDPAKLAAAAAAFLRSAPLAIGVGLADRRFYSLEPVGKLVDGLGFDVADLALWEQSKAAGERAWGGGGLSAASASSDGKSGSVDRMGNLGLLLAAVEQQNTTTSTRAKQQRRFDDGELRMCTFCQKSFNTRGYGHHVKTCLANPARGEVGVSSSGLIQCEHCGHWKTASSVASHKMICPANNNQDLMGASSAHVKCYYCQSNIPAKHLSHHWPHCAKKHPKSAPPNSEIQKAQRSSAKATKAAFKQLHDELSMQRAIDEISVAPFEELDEIASRASSVEELDTELYMMDEWPGSRMMQPMELEHFLKVLDSYFPEDQVIKWMESMTDPLDRFLSLGRDEDSDSDVESEAQEEDDTSGASESDRFSEEEDLDSDASDSENDITYEEKKKLVAELQTQKEALAHTPQPEPSATLEEWQFLGEGTFNAVLGFGDRHVGLRYVLSRVSAGGDLSESNLSAPHQANKDWTRWVPKSPTDLPKQSCLEEDEDSSPKEVPEIEPLWNTLASLEIIPPDSEVHLDAKLDNEIFMNQRQAQEELDTTITDAQLRIQQMKDTITAQLNVKEKARKEHEETVLKYYRIAAWKQVALGLEGGIRDQKEGFSRVKEAIPASWLIQVEGRPKPAEMPSKGRGGVGAGGGGGGTAAPADDKFAEAVCMACFDGHSTEINDLFFCDGCNMSVHQRCYGITDIPEGDWYCDLCAVLRKRPDLRLKPADVPCQLCPIFHGAMKQLTDGRWAHMSCIFWSEGLKVKDICQMRGLELQEPSSESRTASNIPGTPGQVPAPAPTPFGRELQTPATGASSTPPSSGGPSSASDQTGPSSPTICQRSPVKDASLIAPFQFCSICKGTKGRLVKCSHSGCWKRFHFLCAWFEGFYARCTVQDRSFLGGDANNDYLSGLHLEAFCLPHTPEAMASRDKNEQKKLRLSFAMKGVSSKTKKKSRRAQDKQRGGAGGRQVTARSTDLPPDKYRGHGCMACLAHSKGVLAHLRKQEEDLMTCVNCETRVHWECYSWHEGPKPEAGAPWACLPCREKEDDPRCFLCPRVGGALFPVLGKREGRWAHVFCARNVPGVSVYTNGKVGVGETPKSSKKCSLCNRSKGAMVKCLGSASCSVLFHPLCARLSGMCYARPPVVNAAPPPPPPPPTTARQPSPGGPDPRADKKEPPIAFPAPSLPVGPGGPVLKSAKVMALELAPDAVLGAARGKGLPAAVPESKINVGDSVPMNKVDTEAIPYQRKSSYKKQPRRAAKETTTLGPADRSSPSPKAEPKTDLPADNNGATAPSISPMAALPTLSSPTLSGGKPSHVPNTAVPGLTAEDAALPGPSTPIPGTMPSPTRSSSIPTLIGPVAENKSQALLCYELTLKNEKQAWEKAVPQRTNPEETPEKPAPSTGREVEPGSAVSSTLECSPSLMLPLTPPQRSPAPPQQGPSTQHAPVPQTPQAQPAVPGGAAPGLAKDVPTAAASLPGAPLPVPGGAAPGLAKGVRTAAASLPGTPLPVPGGAAPGLAKDIPTAAASVPGGTAPGLAKDVPTAAASLPGTPLPVPGGAPGLAKDIPMAAASVPGTPVPVPGETAPGLAKAVPTAAAALPGTPLPVPDGAAPGLVKDVPTTAASVPGTLLQDQPTAAEVVPPQASVTAGGPAPGSKEHPTPQAPTSETKGLPTSTSVAIEKPKPKSPAASEPSKDLAHSIPVKNPERAYGFCCDKHSPKGMYRLSTGSWVDVRKMGQLRKRMEKARLILDTVKRREKAKSALEMTARDCMEAKFILLREALASKKRMLLRALNEQRKALGLIPQKKQKLKDADDEQLLPGRKLSSRQKRKSDVDASNGYERVATKVGVRHRFSETAKKHCSETLQFLEKEDKSVWGPTLEVLQDAPKGFELLMQASHLEKMADSVSSSRGESITLKKKRKSRAELDCMLEFIINRILGYRVPIQKTDKKWCSADEGDQSRLVSELLQYVQPKEDNPFYHQQVRQSMDLDTINYKVQNFCYDSVEEFQADIETLSKNTSQYYGRYTRVTKDAHFIKLLVGDIMDHYNWKLKIKQSGSVDLPVSRPTRRAPKRKGTSNRGDATFKCSSCNKQVFDGLPKPSTDKHLEALCSVCLKQRPEAIVGRMVVTNPVELEQEVRSTSGQSSAEQGKRLELLTVLSYNPTLRSHQLISPILKMDQWTFASLEDEDILFAPMDSPKSGKHDSARSPATKKRRKKW